MLVYFNLADGVYSIHPKLLVCFSFSRFIDFIMHLDIIYIEIHNEIIHLEKTKTTNNLGRMEDFSCRA